MSALSFSSGQCRRQSWQGMVRLPGIRGKYVPRTLRGLCVTLWHQRPGWVRGVGRISIHGHIKQDSLSAGYLWGRARHSHTLRRQFTHTLCAVQFPAVSFNPPQLLQVCVTVTFTRKQKIHTRSARTAYSSSLWARITPRHWSGKTCLLAGVRECDRVES